MSWTRYSSSLSEQHSEFLVGICRIAAITHRAAPGGKVALARQKGVRGTVARCRAQLCSRNTRVSSACQSTSAHASCSKSMARPCQRRKGISYRTQSPSPASPPCSCPPAASPSMAGAWPACSDALIDDTSSCPSWLHSSSSTSRTLKSCAAAPQPIVTLLSKTPRAPTLVARAQLFRGKGQSASSILNGHAQATGAG